MDNFVIIIIHPPQPPEYLQEGSEVCDLAHLSDVFAMVAAVRDDIVVIDCRMLEVPGAVGFELKI
jgi:hypothetical protein